MSYSTQHTARFGSHSGLSILPASLLIYLMIAFSPASDAATNDFPAGHQLRLLVPAGYLPQLPTLVRVEVLTASLERDWRLWDGEASLAVDSPSVTLSTNRVLLRNGVGSILVSFNDAGDFQLTASIGNLQATRTLVSLAAMPVTTIGGTLPMADTVWSGILQVTNDLTVPAGITLTLLPNTLVLMNGVASGTNGADLVVNGRIDSQGTEDQPVTITCAQPALNLRWGQIRHEGGSLATAPLSVYRHTIITRAGRARGEGHTQQAPILRPNNARVTMQSCSLTDHAEMTSTAQDFGTPGKIGYGRNSDLIFEDCLFQRARSGPEIQGTALLFTNGCIMDMRGPDDADGIYIQAQGAGQTCALKHSIVAAGDDDGIDTLDSTVRVEHCIIREWNSTTEDAKGISVFNGRTIVERSILVDSTVGIAAKTSNAGTSVRVDVLHCTLAGNLTNLLAQRTSNATGSAIDYRITNSIMAATVDSLVSDFSPTNFTVAYCTLTEEVLGPGNLMADPMFADLPAHDFRLLPLSPCIDSGDPASPLDPDGSPTDMGALTFQPPSPLLSVPEIQAQGTRFVLQAYTNRNWVVEMSADESSWSALITNFQVEVETPILDASATNASLRFYRARLAD